MTKVVAASDPHGSSIGLVKRLILYGLSSKARESSSDVMDSIEAEDDNPAQISSETTIEQESTEQEVQADVEDQEDGHEDPRLDAD
jgi:hypothetical protein